MRKRAAALGGGQRSVAGALRQWGEDEMVVSSGSDMQHLADIGILTIRDDEFEAALEAFPEGQSGPLRGRRQYYLRSAASGEVDDYRLAIFRVREQGNTEAQSAARDLIEDLSPRLILVLGIAGGVPHDDFSLGDVVISTRVSDYTVEARKQGGDTTYVTSGGPLAAAVVDHVVSLPAHRTVLDGWSEGLGPHPPVSVIEECLYGPDEWKRRVRESLEAHFPSGAQRSPSFKDGLIASSDRLVKDTEIIETWKTTARNILAVEMESAGVYKAAHQRVPMIAVRGISDVVGYKRDDAWTKYACRSAALFARAFLKTTPIPPR